MQTGANSAPSNSGRISGQKKLLRAARHSYLLPDLARQLSSQYCSLEARSEEVMAD